MDTPIDPTTWRVVVVRWRFEDGSWVKGTLLRGPEWLAEYDPQVGGSLRLDLPEMGVQGRAKVLSVEACPEIEAGPGRLVLSLFEHSRGVVYDLWLEGSEQPIGVTFAHPVWSEDRRAWVSAGELEPGERLRGVDGIVAVRVLLPRGEEPVYNIEVDGDHVYRVGMLGLLVHNASVGDRPCPPASMTNCMPVVQSASATEYFLVNENKKDNVVYGQLKSGGILDFLISNLPKDEPPGCQGWWMFMQMLSHFGVAIHGILSHPSGAKPEDSDNLDETNKQVFENMKTLLEAVWLTKTGGYAKTWGAKSVKEIPPGSKIGEAGTRLAGKYVSYWVLFE